MDGLSAVAGVAIAGVQLSKTLYDLYSTVRTSRDEIQDVANNVSLLAMVLEELDRVLCDDQLEYRPQLREAAHSIAVRCASIFNDIRKYTGTDREPKGQRFYEKAAWYFKRERVKLLRTSLESLKSTLNILLHTVQLAKNTRGVEEYPGVKSIGHWYLRRERRGLVYLVIDNRHAVETLKRLEGENGEEDMELIENERPLALADIFPLSTATRRRGQSPERKFVVAFRNSACRSDDDSRRTQEPEIDFLQASPSMPHGDTMLLPSPSREGKSPLRPPTSSDTESIDQSTFPKTLRRSRTRARSNDEVSTSRLILDVIPHEIADEALKSAQNMSRSTLLEAKAEETIDLLMRNCTYLDPEYFSADDRSTSSADPPVSLLQMRSLQNSHQEEGLDHAEILSRIKVSDLLDVSGPTTDPDKCQSLPLGNQKPKTSSSTEQNPRGTKTSEPSSPMPQSVQDGQEAKARTLFHNRSNQALQSPKEPSTPAPPYPSSPSGQCPSCSAASDSGSKIHTDMGPHPPRGAQISDVERGNETSTSMDSAIRLFETKILEIMKQHPLPSTNLDSQPSQVAEQRENLQQSVTIEQESEPVILKDCLGRKFLFPIQKCRTWQNMENLIKHSFSHVESMNSKIFRGSYDILSPTGEIILPEIWDSVIKPGWVVELRFWDFPAVGENSQNSDEGVADLTPVVQSSSTASRRSHIELSSGNQLATAKRHTPFRTWLGSRKSTPSIALG